MRAAHRPAAAILLCLALGAGAESLDAASHQGRCVPIRRIARGLAVVPVEIEGFAVHPFLLDTGSDPTLIDRGLAVRLGLRPTARITLVTTTGLVEAHEVTASVALAGLRTPDLPLVPAPLDTIRAVDRQVHGVLGQDVLGRSSWLLDNRRGVLVLDPDGSLAASLTGERLAVRWSHGRPAIDAIFGRTPVTLVLDSAATNIVLYERPAREATALPMRLTTLENVDLTVAAVKADALRIGGSAIERPVAAIVPRDDEAPGEDGLLPTALFDTVYFDRVRNEVIVQPASPAPRPSIGSCTPDP